MNIRQYELWDNEGSAKLVCWLDRNLAVGSVITLKAIPDVKWVVIEVYKHSLTQAELPRHWHVGGL